MKKITTNAISAFLRNENFNNSNTQILVTDNYVKMYLFGNLIAKKDLSTLEISISNCGYFTNTTKERLNGLPCVNIRQKNFEWFLNGQKWDGNFVVVNN